jgi:glucose-1-phosphate thymidylyltransferase
MLPLTARTNKHLLPVHMRPMIEYALGTLLQVGLREILVVTGRQHMGQVVECLGSGAAYGTGVDLTFKVQERAGGIAEALRLGERFAGGRRVAVVLGDNIFDDDSIAGVARRYAGRTTPDAVNFLARVPDARAYGVATVRGRRILRIAEKPRRPASDLAVTGLYLYPPEVFARARALRPSARGEVEVSDLNNLFAREGRLLGHRVRRWFDAGEPGPWMRAQRFVESHPERFPPSRFHLRSGD